MCDRPPPQATGDDEDSGQTRRNRQPPRHAAAAWQHGRITAMWCVDTASTGLKGKRQCIPGDKRWAFARRRPAKWKLSCRRRLCGSSNSTPHSYGADRRWFRRPTAFTCPA